MPDNIKIKLPVQGQGGVDSPAPNTSGENPVDTDVNKVTINETEYTLDNGGNAVDTEGKILKTKDELEKLKTPSDSDQDGGQDGDQDGGQDPPKPDVDNDFELIAIDDKEYRQDKDGNALNEDGSIFMTKEELDTLAVDDSTGDPPKGDDNTLSISEIEKLSGIELFGEDGKKIEYEDSPEGIAKREADIKNTFLKQGQESATQTLFEYNPDLYRMYMYKKKHNTLEGYKEAVDYSTINLDPQNEQQLSDIIIESEMKKGNNIERAKKIVGYIKADGNLEEEAKEAQQYLISSDNKEREAEKEKEKQSIKQQVEAAEKHYGFRFKENGDVEPLNVEGSVYDYVVNKGRVDDIIIPTDGIKVKNGDGKVNHYSRKDILNYISAVKENGYSQAQLDEAKRLSNTNKLIKQYIYNLTGGDLSSLVESSKRREQVQKLKTRYKTKQSTNPTNAGKSKQVKLPVQ